MAQRHQGLRGLGRIAGTTAALAALAGWAGAQESVQPYDVNSVRPGQPGGDRVVRPAATSGAQGEVAPADESATYRVSRFLVEYRAEHPQNPTMESVLTAPVVLGVRDGVFVAPAGAAQRTTVRLQDVQPGNPGTFSAGALTAMARGVVEELQRQGLASIIVQISDQDIDPETGADKRPGAEGDLRLIVWVGEVGQVRTIAGGEALEGRIQRGALTRVDADDRVHNRIREQSPARVGELVNKRAIDDFVHRLNRHPGRRVDVAVGPGEQEGQVALDYVISESKPWSLYGQLSNTGTEATSEWRQRAGFVHNNLTRSDDVLRLDYITSSFDESHAVLASYEFPLRSDVLRMRLYGGYSEFDASEVGLGDEEFSGQNYTAGGELAWTVLQQSRFFVDAIAGVRWQSVRVENELFLERGRESYLVPYFGARAERVTDVSELYLSALLEWQESSLTNASAENFNQLGRPAIDEDWQILKVEAYQSFYIEPLISDVFWGRGEGGPTTLAHEVVVSARGQYAFNNRVLANEQDVIGGFFSVRGYPESLSAGDTAIAGTVEYRLHLPRLYPVSRPGFIGEREMRGLSTFAGENFRYAPQELFGRTDWDLILRAFVDAGTTDISRARTGEDQQTLVGSGVGVEFQYKRNVTARLDWGFALSDVDTPGEEVDAGDNRVHFLLTLLY